MTIANNKLIIGIRKEVIKMVNKEVVKKRDSDSIKCRKKFDERRKEKKEK